MNGLKNGARIAKADFQNVRRALCTGLIPTPDQDRLAPLPYRKTLSGGLRVRLDHAERAVIEKAVVPLFEAAKRQGLGVGAEDFSNISIHDFLLQPEVNVISLVDESNDRVFGATTIYASNNCRSTYPILHASFLVVHPDYRGSGYALFWVMITELIAADLGYVGEGIRAAMTSPLIQHVWKPNHYISATLHRELYDPKKGYVPNVLIYSPFTMRKDYTEVMKQMAEDRLSAQLPELKVTKPEALHDPLDCKSETKTLKNGVVINLEIPCHDTVLQVEDMIREFAARGEYFGWDEFLEDGCYNRRLLSSTHMIVAKTSTGTLAGAALFGGCRFSRSKKIANARLYLFVTPSHRELGIGGALFDKSMKIITDLGYEGVSSDLFPNCHVGAAMLRRRGFVPCGNLMKAACVKGLGFTDSMLFYKDILSVSFTSML